MQACAVNPTKRWVTDSDYDNVFSYIKNNKNLTDRQMGLILRNAIQGGGIKTVSRLIKLYPNIINLKIYNAKPVELAAEAYRKGSTDNGIRIIKILVNAGADIHNSEALHHAAGSFRKDLKMIAFLVNTYGLDVNKKNYLDKTPLHEVAAIATYGGNEADRDRRNIVEAKKIIRFLVEHGGDLSLKDTYGKTPIMLYNESLKKYAKINSSSGFQWGKLAAMATGAALGGAGGLDTASQIAVAGAMVQDSQAGVEGVNNSRHITNQLTAQSLQAGNNTTRKNTVAAAGAPKEQKTTYHLQCASGVSKDIPIWYKSQACLSAKQNLARVYGCNLANEMDAARSQCQSACGGPTCEEK